VDKKQVFCPVCGYQWSFKTMPLFILTGCSGVGKTVSEVADYVTGWVRKDSGKSSFYIPNKVVDKSSRQLTKPFQVEENARSFIYTY
jgi:hypothetical protein